MAIFRDRRHAGRVLAAQLDDVIHGEDAIVLALPRGGVPVAYEVAQRLDLPLDVFIVRKLGAPGHEEYAVGAIASGGAEVLRRDVISQLRVSQPALDAILARERRELQRREQAYRGDRGPLAVIGRTVVVVDDGLATGSTMLAAVAGLRELGPARIVVAVPVASRSACEELGREADAVVCAMTPEPFHGVGLWYVDFSQTTDDEVKALLTAPTAAPAAPSVTVTHH
jgi:predicted phosphoribosyltransferase